MEHVKTTKSFLVHNNIGFLKSFLNTKTQKIFFQYNAQQNENYKNQK